MRRAVVLGILIVTALMTALVTAAAASAKPRKNPGPQPDLQITSFRPELGRPMHAFVDTGGVLEKISIGVVIENRGHAIAGKSTLEVWLEDSVGRRIVKKVRVPALKPGSKHRWAKVVEISGGKAALGFAKIGVSPTLSTP